MDTEFERVSLFKQLFANIRANRCVLVDINKAGLRRVKKGKGIHASGKPVLQMEDVNVVLHPYSSDPNKALFAVFDGHVGKNCATAAKEMWPEEFVSQMGASSSSNDFTEVFKTTYAVVDKRLSEYEYEGLHRLLLK